MGRCHGRRCSADAAVATLPLPLCLKPPSSSLQGYLAFVGLFMSLSGVSISTGIHLKGEWVVLARHSLQEHLARLLAEGGVHVHLSNRACRGALAVLTRQNTCRLQAWTRMCSSPRQTRFYTWRPR